MSASVSGRAEHAQGSGGANDIPKVAPSGAASAHDVPASVPAVRNVEEETVESNASGNIFSRCWNSGTMTSLRRHPGGTYVLFMVEMWERFSYYGMRALLTLYLIHGFGWCEAKAFRLYGIYTTLAYLMPVLGGVVADQFIGNHLSMVFGGVIMAVGHALLAVSGFFPLPPPLSTGTTRAGAFGPVFPHQPTTFGASIGGLEQYQWVVANRPEYSLPDASQKWALESVVATTLRVGSKDADHGYIAGNATVETAPGAVISFYCGLALIVLGTGLFKPSVSVMLGEMYDNIKARNRAEAVVEVRARGLVTAHSEEPPLAKDTSPENANKESPPDAEGVPVDAVTVDVPQQGEDSDELEAQIEEALEAVDRDANALRDSGFALFYMGINIGAAITAFVAGSLAAMEWHLGFGSALVGMLIAVIAYVVVRPFVPSLRCVGKPPWKKRPAAKDAEREDAVRVSNHTSTNSDVRSPGIKVLSNGDEVLSAGKVLSTTTSADVYVTDDKPPSDEVVVGSEGQASSKQAPGSAGTDSGHAGSSDNEAMDTALEISTEPWCECDCPGFLPSTIRRFGSLTKDEWRHCCGILVVSIANFVFFSVMEQAGTTLNILADQLVRRGEIPTAWFQSLNSIFVVCLSPVFAVLWTVLGRHNIVPSPPAKFSAAFVLCAISSSFALFGALESRHSPDCRMSAIWLVALYFVITIAELTLSPSSLAAITALAPKGLQTVAMSIFLVIGYACANYFASVLASIGGTSEDDAGCVYAVTPTPLPTSTPLPPPPPQPPLPPHVLPTVTATTTVSPIIDTCHSGASTRLVWFFGFLIAMPLAAAIVFAVTIPLTRKLFV